MHPPIYPYYKETFEGGELFWGNLKTMKKFPLSGSLTTALLVEQKNFTN